MKKVPYIKNKRLYLGGRRKQTGGWLSLAPLAITAISKLLGGKRRKRRKKLKWYGVEIILLWLK